MESHLVPPALPGLGSEKASRSLGQRHEVFRNGAKLNCWQCAYDIAAAPQSRSSPATASSSRGFSRNEHDQAVAQMPWLSLDGVYANGHLSPMYSGLATAGAACSAHVPPPLPPISDDLQARLQVLEVLEGKREQVIIDLTKQNEELQKRNKELESRNDALGNELEQHKMEFEQHKFLSSAASKDAHRAQNDAHRAQSDLQRHYASEVRRVEEDLQRFYSSEAKRIEGQIQRQHTAQLQELSQQAESMARRLQNELQEERDRLALETSRVKGVEEQRRLSEESISSLRYHLDVANNTIKDLVEKNEELRVEVIECRAQVTFLEEKNTGLRSEEAEMKAENNRLRSEIDELKIENRGVNELKVENRGLQELKVENTGLKSEIDELKAKTRLLVNARRSSQIMGQTDMTTGSGQGIPLMFANPSHYLRFGEYSIAPVVPALVPTSVHDPLIDLQRLDLQDSYSSKMLADLTIPTGRPSMMGDIKAIEHLRPASDQTSEISVDLQSNFSAARASSQMSDMKHSLTQPIYERASIISNVGAKVQVDLTGE